MKASEFAALVKGARRRADGTWWDARCPAHDDKKASLSFRDGDRGLVVTCQAHRCTVDAIAAAVGKRVADLFPPTGAGPDARPSVIVATYDYTDAAGVLRYQVVRYEPKDFRCRRPDGGGWKWNMDGVARLPYRLPELAERPRVFICEGEKDCDALAVLGLAATTNEGGAEKWRPEHTAALLAAAVPELVILPDNDRPGEAHTVKVARSCLAAGLRVKVLPLPGLPPIRDNHGEDVTDWLVDGHTRDELEALADAAPVLTEADMSAADAALAADACTEPVLLREGLDLALTWPDGVRFLLSAIRNGRDGVRGELTVTQHTRRLSWGSLALSSTQARETLRKKLEATAPGLPWSEYLEETTFRLTQAAREGEPIVTLTGTVTSPKRELLPRFLYEGEPTLLYADGDAGKSLVALALAVAVHSGAALPFGLKPARAVPAAYLDWETSRDTLETRLALIAAGLGIDPPAIIYKHMTRPLVDEAAALAADFAHRGIGFVVIDSKMFAVAGGDGAAFHEPITAFYNALRLFAPAASLVLNHITGADARGGGPARPFGGAFAFNGPRLIWEAKRDPDVTDATAIAFTCRKANNLARKPEPFGLRFQPGDGTITVYPFDLTEAAPQTVAGASLPYRVRLALAQGERTYAELAETLETTENKVRVAVNRLGDKVVRVGDSPPYRWKLATP